MHAHRRTGRVGQRLTSIFWLTMSVAIMLLLTTGCGDEPTPTPPPIPTRLPTVTPPPENVLNESLFVLLIDGELYATEEIRVDRSSEQLVVFSEMHIVGNLNPIQRRTMVLSGARGPLRYDMETLWVGARSTWAAERTTTGMDCLTNNLDWHAPTLVEGLSPAADILIESAPSALPFALLALEYEESIAAEPLALHTIDVTEDLPVSRPLTVSVAAERTGAVIGTVALEAKIEGAMNGSFTLWLRPGNRALYGVETDDYRFGLWQRGYGRPVEDGKKLEIRRVRQFPEVTPQVVADAEENGGRLVTLEFAAQDGTMCRGTLTLPPGEGPFPCILAHSPGGPVPRWSTTAPLVEAGWAVYAYDKRGLGESEGTYRRDEIGQLAEDAIAAAEMLRQQQAIEDRPIVFLGYGQGGMVGAQTLAASDGFAGAILGNCAADGSVFPTLADAQIGSLLAPFYGWEAHQVSAYRTKSTRAWQDWLFEGENEVRLLGRRASLASLQSVAEVNMGALLDQAQAPVLLLHESECRRYPIEGARRMAQEKAKANPERIRWHEIEGGADPSGHEDSYSQLSEEAIAAIVTWLEPLAPESAR